MVVSLCVILGIKPRASGKDSRPLNQGAVALAPTHASCSTEVQVYKDATHCKSRQGTRLKHGMPARGRNVLGSEFGSCSQSSNQTVDTSSW